MYISGQSSTAWPFGQGPGSDKPGKLEIWSSRLGTCGEIFSDGQYVWSFALHVNGFHGRGKPK